MLAFIVLNVDKKLWWPLELEITNSLNITTEPAQNKVSTKDIVVILFDNKTQFLLRQDGLPIKDFKGKGRNLISQAIEKLEKSKVSAIGINLNLSDSSDEELNISLAKIIAKYKNIVVASSIYSVPSYSSNKILSSAPHIGYGELYADYDKIVHKTKLIDKGYKDIPSFSYALYKVFSKSEVSFDLKERNEFYLKYPKEPILKYSLIDLIQGEITPSVLEGKIVILGSGLKSKLMKDQILQPFDRSLFISDSEVQAVLLANLLNKSYLFNFSLKDYLFHFVIFSMVLGIVFCSVPIVQGAVIMLALSITQVLFGLITYNSHNFLIELFPILFVLASSFIIGSLVFLQLNLQEQNLELGEALSMLGSRSKELEFSQKELKGKNIQLNDAFLELHKNMQELKEVRKLLSGKSEEERKRIARELHDDTLARITDLRISLESIINGGNISLDEKKQLYTSVQILGDVTSEMRRIINALRPSMLDNVLGLIPAIENLLDELSKRSNNKIQTKLTTSLTKLKLREASEINLYRIIQEALNNVFKHSNATCVELIIEEQPGQILILVRDNGNGFSDDNKNKKGFGLIDMKERAELIGASVQYLNEPKGMGATLEIAMPISEVVNIEKSAYISTTS